ncbi:MAG: hypothetical protein LiPW41_674 [Parcubacteria group bacterium LiPW_41]|nr:MAG: hypothetical protein LiPW41_674 [Parcubacteria group bacterium LiPW_41]
MLELYTSKPEELKKKVDSLTEGVGEFAHEFDPELIYLWCESDPELQRTYKNFVGASEAYADYVCAIDDLVKKGEDLSEIVKKQREAHTNSEQMLKTFVESAHKKGHLQKFSPEELPRPKTAQLALYSAFTNAYEKNKKMMGEAKKAV